MRRVETDNGNIKHEIADLKVMADEALRSKVKVVLSSCRMPKKRALLFIDPLFCLLRTYMI